MLNVIDEWFVIENAIKEKWNKTKLIEILGKPREILHFKGDKQASYIYHDKLTDLQSWAFGFDDNNVISDITYIPTSEGWLYL